MPYSAGTTYKKTVGNSGDLNALDTTIQNVHTKPGEIWHWTLNNNGAKAYLRIYNKAANQIVSIATERPHEEYEIPADVSHPPASFVPAHCNNANGFSVAATNEPFDGVNANNPAGTITGQIEYKVSGGIL